ncbi:MAG: START-like domain-containing protein [Flavobacteriales bacterium]
MIQYSLEIPFKSSVRVLYSFIASPSGLSDWFADQVNLKGKHYIFVWDGYPQEAKVLSKKNNHHIRFQWIEEEDYPFFELKIVVDAITNDVALVITDYADDEEDVEDGKRLWQKQLTKLKGHIGS